MDGKSDLRIGELADVVKFFDAVMVAIDKGELDEPIGKLQADKSAALKNGKRLTEIRERYRIGTPPHNSLILLVGAQGLEPWAR